MKMGFEKLS